MSWDDAHEYVALLNRQNYAEHSDWRLPDIDELRKFQIAATKARLAGFCGSDAVVSRLCREGFRNVQAGNYWSGTTSMFYNVEAWFIDMTSGSLSAANKALYMYVWPVHTEGGCSRNASGRKSHNRSTQERQ